MAHMRHLKPRLCDNFSFLFEKYWNIGNNYKISTPSEIISTYITNELAEWGVYIGQGLNSDCPMTK